MAGQSRGSSDSPAPVLCHTADKAVDSSKLKYLSSRCTQYPSSSPAQTGAVCVEWPWPPSLLLQSPSSPAQGQEGDGAGGAASPKPPPNSTEGFKKCDFCLQSVSNALCSLPTPRTPHLPLPNSRDCTWQQQQLHPEPLRVSLSSVNKSCFPSSFPDRADGLCPSWDPELAGRQQGRELRTISSARDKISKQASQTRALIFFILQVLQGNLILQNCIRLQPHLELPKPALPPRPACKRRDGCDDKGMTSPFCPAGRARGCQDSQRIPLLWPCAAAPPAPLDQPPRPQPWGATAPAPA